VEGVCGVATLKLRVMEGAASLILEGAAAPPLHLLFIRTTMNKVENKNNNQLGIFIKSIFWLWIGPRCTHPEGVVVVHVQPQK